MRKLTRTHQLPTLQMRAEFQPQTMDTEKRTVQMTWTTGARVLRGFWDPYYEELSLDPNHVRMGRLQSGNAPLLNAHNSDDINDVIGVIESAKLDSGGRSGSATVRFDKGADGSEAMRKVADGILRNVSVGYRTYKMQKVEGGDDTTPVYRAVDWEPYELSMVPIGADAGAATRAASVTNPCEFTEERAMDPEKPTTTPITAPITTTDEVAAKRAERERVLGIQSVARKLGRPDAEADKAITDGTTLDAYRALAIDAREVAPPDKGGHIGIDKRDPRIEVGKDAREKWQRGAMAWLLQRCGSDVVETVKRYAEKTGEKIDFDPGEFRGMRMLDLARAGLDRCGIEHRGLSQQELFGAALTSRSNDSFFSNRSPAATTGDFPLLLENTLHKILLAAYGITPDTWRSVCTVGSLVDFRPSPRYRMGSFSALEKLTELGEYRNKSIPDAEKASITADTKGNIIGIDRKALINDDMSAFSRLAMMFGRAAALSIEIDFYALLALNAGLGPTMGDALTLYHATHGNIGVGSALGSNALDADRVLMKAQKDPSGNELLDIRPAVLLVPAGLGMNARQINAGQFDFDSLTKAGAARSTYAIPNGVGGLFRDIVDTARIAGTRRYIFADPAIYPTFEVAFLDGQQNPYMEMRQQWRADGVEWKVRLDYVVGAIDWRGTVTNAGA